jgi:hypothetical protein
VAFYPAIAQAVIIASFCCSATMAADCTKAIPVKNEETKTWTTPRSKQTDAKWTRGRLFEHVVIVVFENHDYEEVLANPIFKAVGERGVVFNRFLGSFHPSYPNYLAMIGARYFGTVGDQQEMINRKYPAIVDKLEAKGLSWAAYAERYSGQCSLDDSDATELYQRKHVPFLSFESITGLPERCAKIVSLDAFDWKQLPNYSFVTPDMCNDGHNEKDCEGESTQIARASTWLEKFLAPTVQDPSVLGNTLVVITFDESRAYARNHIFTVFLGDMVKGGTREDGCFDHYNVLRTIEENFAIGTLEGEDKKSSPITSVWK